jgi:hypothetical protein
VTARSELNEWKRLKKTLPSGRVFVVVRMTDGRSAEWLLEPKGLSWVTDLPFMLSLQPTKTKGFDGVLEADSVLMKKEWYESMSRVLGLLARADEHASDHCCFHHEGGRLVLSSHKSHTWGKPAWKRTTVRP